MRTVGSRRVIKDGVYWKGRRAACIVLRCERESEEFIVMRSFEEHLEHLVFLHAEMVIGKGAAEVGDALLVLDDLVAALPVVGGGETGVGVAVGVAAVSNVQITPSKSPSSECWPAVGVAVDQLLSLLWHVLLCLIEGEQEGPPLLVVHIVATADWFPAVVGVAADGSARLGSNEDEGVLGAVATRVEGLSLEAVFGGAENQLQPHRSPKALPQELRVLLALIFRCLKDEGVEEVGGVGWD
jgi:hypothetical protein